MLLLSNSRSSCCSTEHSLEEREAVAMTVRGLGDCAAFDLVNVAIQTWARLSAPEVALRVVLDEKSVRVSRRLRGLALENFRHFDLEDGVRADTHPVETEAVQVS